MRILVTGVSGPLGRTLVRHAASGPHLLCGLSRRPPGSFPDSVGDWHKADLSTGEGLAAALDGVDVVIHAASDPERPDLVDVHGTALLTAAARDVGVRHFVYVSIVGVDRIRTRTMPLPTRIGRAFRAGANTAPDGERGAITWRDWLSRRASQSL